MRRLSWAALFVVSTVGAVLAACGETDYTEGFYDKRYGQPDSLRGASPPEPYNTNNPTGDAGGGGTGGLCNGKGPIDGGPCSVSFKTQLMPLFVEKCASPSCHGAPAGAKPQVDRENADKTYQNFISQKPITGKPYVDPCTLDKTASSITCNLAATNSCGNAMPLGAAGSLGTQPIYTLTDTWLACGAPNN